MPDQGTSVARLTYGELIVALGASDLPTRRRVSDAEAISYAVQGLARLGLDGVRAVQRDALRLGRVAADGGPGGAAAATAHGALFGGSTRADRACGAAYSLRFGTGRRLLDPPATTAAGARVLAGITR